MEILSVLAKVFPDSNLQISMSPSLVLYSKKCAELPLLKIEMIFLSPNFDHRISN